jgi:large conductance mechanosensitive channel
MFKEFKKFILRGNVVDLAVAVVIGAAFSGLVTAFVKDFLNPMIGAVQGHSELARYSFSLHGIQFPYGDFLNTLLTFLLTAGVVFFVVVQPLNHPTTRKCPECLSEIPRKATRCMYCTAKVTPQAS